MHFSDVLMSSFYYLLFSGNHCIFYKNMKRRSFANLILTVCCVNDTGLPTKDETFITTRASKNITI